MHYEVNVGDKSMQRTIYDDLSLVEIQNNNIQMVGMRVAFGYHAKQNFREIQLKAEQPLYFVAK